MSHTAQASCVYDYVERDNVKMRVCGACGLRDPFDPCVKKINLNKVNAEHWLHLDTEAETRLRDLRPFTLAKVGADGGIEEVVVQRAMLHNMARVADNGGALHTYHVVPEALVVEDDRGRGEGADRWIGATRLHPPMPALRARLQVRRLPPSCHLPD